MSVKACLFTDATNGERDGANAAVFKEDNKRDFKLARLSDSKIAFILNLAMRRDGNLFVELRTEANFFVSGFAHADDAQRQRRRIRDAEGDHVFADGQRANVPVAIVYRDRLPERRLVRRGEVEDANYRK